jgi:DNA invertase Pin-like site-specific DNA recombinase
MERPALQRLLTDINQGSIDAVIVYKVDRLTRLLTDFAKMVEVFDARGVSFVAVTQQFNTTTSMGRLTLNILLSFAQFERAIKRFEQLTGRSGDSCRDRPQLPRNERAPRESAWRQPHRCSGDGK